MWKNFIYTYMALFKCFRRCKSECIYHTLSGIYIVIVLGLIQQAFIKYLINFQKFNLTLFLVIFIFIKKIVIIFGYFDNNNLWANATNFWASAIKKCFFVYPSMSLPAQVCPCLLKYVSKLLHKKGLLAHSMSDDQEWWPS
jgi:hypothetical protein